MAAQLAQAEGEMQQAMASGDFEKCISLRDKVKTLRLAALEEQMQQATIKQDFETCIRLRSEIAALQ